MELETLRAKYAAVFAILNEAYGRPVAFHWPAAEPTGRHDPPRKPRRCPATERAYDALIAPLCRDWESVMDAPPEMSSTPFARRGCQT